MTYKGKRNELILRRKQSLMPQMMVAMKLGVSQAQYSNIELGYTNPSNEIAEALIDMFGLSKDYFGEQESAGVAREA